MPLPGLAALSLTRRNRAVGSPGLLTTATAAYRRAPTAETLVALVLLTGVAAAAAASLGGSALTVGGVTGAGLLLLHVAIRRTSAVLTCALLAGFILCTPMIASGYLAATGGVDYPFAMTALWVAAALIALVAHRTSVGRAPLTVALALAALALLGPLVAFVLPPVGFLGGYAAAALVLAWRAGRLTRPRVRAAHRAAHQATHRAETSDPAHPQTAAVLAGIGPDHTVLTGVHPPRTARPIPHVVIGPSGITVIDSQQRTGVIREHPVRGLELDGQSLTETLTDTLAAATALAAALDVDRDAVIPALVLHGVHLPAPRTVVALVDPVGQPAGQVLVLAPEALLTEVATSDVPVADPAVVTALIRRARRLRGARTTDTAADPAAAHTATVIDGDGLPKQFTEQDNPQPLFRSTSVDTKVLVGQAVALLTDQGTFDGIRVCSAPTADPDGTITVQVCLEGEWQQARSERRDPETFAYPLASVSAAS